MSASWAGQKFGFFYLMAAYAQQRTLKRLLDLSLCPAHQSFHAKLMLYIPMPGFGKFEVKSELLVKVRIGPFTFIACFSSVRVGARAPSLRRACLGHSASPPNGWFCGGNVDRRHLFMMSEPGHGTLSPAYFDTNHLIQ